jgi:23S rRNA (cytidine1920-2'-O)/16S rRNA (cytidine1409-2'-O)-methyltransferase
MKVGPRICKLRLDEILVDREWVDSRARAKGLILAGEVLSGTQVLDKPGKLYPADIELHLRTRPRFVSRGGLKLEGFLKAFPLALDGLRALDAGASTGGFTDCLLQAGVAHVTCVDVGRGQLHASLRQDSRVTNIEGVNIRHLDPKILPFPEYDLIVGDLSFISLKNILPVLWPLLAENGQLVTLIKPQFEAGRSEADKGRGIIRDPVVHERVIAEIRAFAEAHLPGSREFGFCLSPIEGNSGNREFLIGWRKENSDA